MTPGHRVSRARVVLAFIEVLLLAVWLGSMMFFAFAMAPSAFSALPSPELAGRMVSSALSKVEILGLIIGMVLISLCAATWRVDRAGRAAKVTRL